jgi:deazaflavin-dependent oxidoreductase (nitroreductase family)
VPVITLLTTGSRSGRVHAAPLAAIQHEGGVVVIGSNFGRPSGPAWARNLVARPEAMAELRESRVAVRARRLRGAEATAALAAACEVYPPFAAYVARARDRQVPIFILEPRRPSPMTPPLAG